MTSQQKSVQGKGRGWLLASQTPHTSCGLCLGWGQEDNHNYYVSRLYGPSEPRSRELWVDVAKANQSQVKVHRILSNTHRQASVSMPVPGSAALGWEAGGQGVVPGQWAWLWPEVGDPGDAFQGKLGGGLARVKVPTRGPGGLSWTCLPPALSRQAWGSVRAQLPGLQHGPC